MILGYFALISIFGVVAGVMAIPNVAVMVMLVTFGLGMPLIFAATGFVYGLCLFPAVAAWRLGSGWGLAVSAAVIGAVAILPGYDAQRRAEDVSLLFRRSDFAPPLPVVAASLEIRRLSVDYGTFLDQDACGYECRALLTYGQVEWVRVVMIDQHGASIFFRLERGKNCDTSEDQKPETATCVVPAQDKGEAPELTIVFEAPALLERNEPGPLRPLLPRSTKTVTAHLRKGEEEREILHQTEVGIDVAMVPTIWGPRFGYGLSSGGLDIARRGTSVNPISLTDALARLGFSVERPPAAGAVETTPARREQGINETMTREVLAILNLPQTAPFNPQQSKLIDDWIMHARGVKEWSSPLLDLLRRIVRDRRLRSAAFFDQIFERDAVVTAALMPDILDMIATDGIGPDYTAARGAAYTFPRLAPRFLEPHADKIVALLGRGGAVREILLPVAGRLGVDPSLYLLPFDADLEPTAKNRSARIEGACYAERRWAPQLLGPLKETLHSNPKNERERRAKIFAAIASLGDLDFVMQNLTHGGDEARLLSRLVKLSTEARYRPNSVCSIR